MLSYVNAADVVVSMAGYNTICEILSLRKRAIIVPRVSPVREQQIRAERMARLSLFKMVHPGELTPRVLMDAVKSELQTAQYPCEAPAGIEMDALPRIAQLIRNLTAKAKAVGAGVALQPSTMAGDPGREDAA